MLYEDYKNEIEKTKEEIKYVLLDLKLKQKTEEIIYSDSITYNNIDLSKKEFRVFLNYTYFEREKNELKKTRENLFYLSSNKIEKLKDDKLFFVMNKITKLYNLFRKYKNLVEQIEIDICLNYDRVITTHSLISVFDFEKATELLNIEMKKLSKFEEENYNKLTDYLNKLKKEEQLYRYERKK